MVEVTAVDWSILKHYTVVTVGKDMAKSVGGLRFDSRAGQIGHCRQQLATAAMFLRNCVSQALS